jgi:hypothetical protein
MSGPPHYYLVLLFVFNTVVLATPIVVCVGSINQSLNQSINMLLLYRFLLVLSSVLFLAASSAKAQFENINFGQPKECPPFRCRKDEEPVPKWPLQLESSGCSHAGAIVNLNDGEKDEESVLDACCHQRHACVQTCGSLKAVCEQDFLVCGETACQTLSNDDDDANEKNQQKTCTQQLQLQKILASMDSCNEYANAQTKNCQCLSSKEAPQARLEFLTRFYSKYNPSEQQNDDVNDKKIRALAAKADTARKMSTLIGKLVKKYPQAIQNVKDPQQEYMERMMKETREEKKDDDNDDDNDDGTGMEDLGVEEL